MSEEHPVHDGNAADPLIGMVLAERYRIERRLGEGGMGAVYLARHVILEKIVALKILHDEYARRRELVERFLHEAKAASRIRHEHVIDITDFGETATKNVFFAMEFLDGQDLATELDHIGPMPWPRVKSIILQIASALQAAHEAGVIHRDLKPENIYLIERMGHPDFVKVLDFGVAKLTELEESRERRLTRTGMVFGTPEYMSPEQARGEKPDIRVDVYALGCILFEMLTGDVPYRADNFMGVLTKHLFDPTPVLKERTDRSDLPEGLQGVLSQALAKDKNQRFSSMNELAIALDTLDHTEGIVYHAGSTTGDRSRRNQLGRATSSEPVRPRAGSSSEAARSRASSSSEPVRARSSSSGERSSRSPVPAAAPTPAPASPADPFEETHLDTPIQRGVTAAPAMPPDEERTIPRMPAARPIAAGGESEVETDDFERLPKKKGTLLYLGAGAVALALAVGGVVALRARSSPSDEIVPVPIHTTAPQPAATAPAEPAPTTPPPVAAPPVPPEPAPAPVAATPDAVAAPPPVPDAAPIAAPPPQPTPEVVPEPVVAAPPSKHHDRDRDKTHDRTRPPRVDTTPSVRTPPPPPVVAPPPPQPEPEPMVPKSDLKDPFRKK